MSPASEGAADVELECPKCGIKPLVIAGNEPQAIYSITDYSGLSCADCGYVVSESDVEWAMKSDIYSLVSEGFGEQWNRKPT